MIGGSFRRYVAKLACAGCALVLLTACQSSSSSTHEEFAPEDDAPIFSSKIFGVKASPRVTRLKKVPKGGGRDQIGKPYVVKGKWYYPKEEPGYVRSGTASWYGANFHGRLTANGEVYDMYHLSAAHPTFPLPSYARVTNRKNGSSVLVRVNDRGPYVHDRVLDVSAKAADMLGFQNDGVADVKVEYVGRAPLEGDDTRMLMASYRPANSRPIDDGLPSGVMIASVKERSPLMVASAFSPPRLSNAPASPKARPTASPSIEDLIQSYDVPESAPIPTTRGSVLSYATQRGLGGAALALSSLADRAPRREGERIEIGAVSDPGLMMHISELLHDGVQLVEEGDAGNISFSLQLPIGMNGDELLTQLWTAGAEDAFVVKN